jgi:hypothetical protein
MSVLDVRDVCPNLLPALKLYHYSRLILRCTQSSHPTTHAMHYQKVFLLVIFMYVTHSNSIIYNRLFRPQTPPTSPPKRPFVARPPSASRSAFVDQLSSLFRRPLSYVRDYTTHDMPSRHTMFSWYQLKRDQPDTKLELQPEVEVPCTRDLVVCFVSLGLHHLSHAT